MIGYDRRWNIRKSSLLNIHQFAACLWVYLCFSFFKRKSFSWQSKTIKCNTRVWVSDGMLRKFFCIKDLCLRVKETHLQTGNCAKERKLNRVMPQELKGNYKLFKKSKGWKAQRTFSFFYTSLGAVLTQHKGNFAELTLHRIGSLLLDKKRWLKSWHNRRKDPLNLAVVVAPPVWALLVDALRVEDF